MFQQTKKTPGRFLNFFRRDQGTFQAASGADGVSMRYVFMAVAALAKIGVTHINLSFQAATLSETLDNIQRFGEQVIAKMG